MSVKFQDESLRKETKELAHKVGERLTGGNSQNGYLAVCPSLSSHPSPSGADIPPGLTHTDTHRL
jgi:hypothetical protein